MSTDPHTEWPEPTADTLLAQLQAERDQRAADREAELLRRHP